LKVRSANRFLRALPGAWRGKWRHLHIRSDFDGEASRENFIAELRATIAFLEAYIAKRAKGAASAPSPRIEGPIDADFSEVPTKPSQRLKVVE
jgi:hypothetical protein